jgi:membrane-associated phospholipid phosphatase
MGKTVKAKVAKTGESLQKADGAVARAVAPYRETALVAAIEPVAKLGDQPPLRAVCGAVIAAGLIGGDRRLMRAGVRMLAAHTLATWTKNFLKHRIDRTRPRKAVEKGRGHHLSAGRKRTKEETSFPSGHSAGAAAVACGFAREYPEHRAAAASAAGLIALGQIPRCAHYPTDIGAGLAIGIAAEMVTDAAFRALDRA